jgi:hypothetical protein
MPSLVLGPLLRYVGETEAVIWVETDAPCEVEVLGAREPTFCVCDHHYALVCCGGLEPGSWHEYEVLLDGERAWPLDDGFPSSQFRTYPKDGTLQIVFGSCRVAAPHEPPYTLSKDEDERGREIDALRTMALRMRDQPRDDRPDVLLMLGDQVYADEVSPATRAFIETKRHPSEPPGERVLDFEDYTQLYLESWSDPAIRWLMSVVSTAMIFDDHDVHDDWNISEAWLEEMRKHEWWNEHIKGALASYWVYQHLGNLAPEAHQEDALLKKVKEADDAEWDWVHEHATGDFDHLLVATSLPWLLGRGMHYVEAWNEAVAGGAWGPVAARAAEGMRQSVDLEHWAAFQESFSRIVELFRAVGSGERGTPPASIVALSGDVHHAYLFEVGYPRGTALESNVWQAVCSPYRNPLGKSERQTIRIGMSRGFEVFARALARLAGVRDPGIGWRLKGDGPWFDNQVATLEIEGRDILMRLEKAVPVNEHEARLECVLEQPLA